MAYSFLTTYKIRVKDVEGNEIEMAGRTEDLLSVSELNSSVIEISAGMADLPVSLGGVSVAKYLLIETDNPIKIKLNDVANTEIPITRFLILNGGDFTKLYVSNSGTDSATVRILIGG